MTKAELATITGFSWGRERDYRGNPVHWPDYWYPTMVWVSRLRSWVNSSCVLIRGDHNLGASKPFSADKQTAIDCYFPDAPFGRVMMEMMRLPDCSWGVYAGQTGGSVHLDLRQTPDGRPARWMAVSPQHEPVLVRAGLGSLISGRADGWIYCTWSSALGVNGLALVQRLVDEDLTGLLNPV